MGWDKVWLEVCGVFVGGEVVILFTNSRCYCLILIFFYVQKAVSFPFSESMKNNKRIIAHAASAHLTIFHSASIS